jgi:hypothetical protein
MSFPPRFPTSLSARAIAISALLAIFAVLPSAALALPAPTLFVATGGTGNSSVTAPPSPLYKIDPGNGATLATVGNTGYAITGLAQDPTSGILYGVSNNKSPLVPRALITIDPATGAAALVGQLSPGENRIADISFNSFGQLYGWNESGDILSSIDKATGTVTKIGKNELSTYGSGLSFDRNDTLWFFGLGELEPFHTLNTATGVATPAGKLTAVDNKSRPISAAAWDCARTTLYGILSTEGEAPYKLLNINTTSGLLTNLGTTVFGADAVEWYCPLAFEFAKPAITTTGGKTISIGVLRGPLIKGAASVSFATKAGSAKAGQDFVATSGPLAFANNVGEGTISLRVKKNPKAGSNRKLTVLLSGPSAGGTTGAALTVTIKPGKPAAPSVKGPAVVIGDSATFKLRAKQLPARFRCKLDGGKFKACGKNTKKGRKFTTTGLTFGPHTLTVQVVNGAGKKSKPEKKVFAVLLP